jgi:hypothetical protein
LEEIVGEFLITGCGRSGTKYTAKVLQKAGLDVQHEKPGRDGTVSSVWAVEDTWYPGYHAQKRPEFDLILHQVREPLATIGSLTTALQGSWNWNARHIPIDPKAPSLIKAARYWYYWNLKIEEIAQHRYRVEDMKDEWEFLCMLLGCNCRLPNVSKKTNSREHIRVNWLRLSQAVPDIYTELRTMSERYGYT